MGSDKRGAWSEGECRCRLKRVYCDRMKCPSGKEGQWRNEQCMCWRKIDFRPSESCDSMRCPVGKEGKRRNQQCMCERIVDFRPSDAIWVHGGTIKSASVREVEQK